MLDQYNQWQGNSYHILDKDDFNTDPGEYSFISPNYIFFIWLEGASVITCDNISYEIYKDDAFIFLPNIKYTHLLLPGTVRKGIIISPRYFERTNFNVKFGENIALIFKPLLLSLTQCERQGILSLFDFLAYITDSRGGKEYQEEIEVNAFFTLFFEIFALYKRHLDKDLLQKTPRSLELWTRFIGLLSLHFKKKRTVEFYANELHVTPNYFSETIKAVRGKTASQVIVDTVINEAKALLKNHRLSVSNIADELNFPDQATFTKYFKHHTGDTPTQYRKKIFKG